MAQGGLRMFRHTTYIGNLLRARRRPALAVLLAAHLSALGRSVAPAAETLPAALAQNLAQAVIRGANASSGDSLVIEATNLTGQEQAWRIAPGTLARSRHPNAPDMAIRRVKGRRFDAARYQPGEAIRLGPHESAAFVCEAYSLDFRKANPASAHLFQFDKPDAMAQRLFAAAQQIQAPPRAIQAAIWIARNGAGQAELARRFPVLPGEFAMAQGLVRMAESAPASGLAAGALSRPATASPSAPAVELSIEADAPEFAFGEDGLAVSIPIRYKWEIAPARRPRIVAICHRLESAAGAGPIAIEAPALADGEGRFLLAVEGLDPAFGGELAIAALRDVTIATAADQARQLFEEDAPKPRGRISNMLRVPLAGGPAAASAPAAESAP